MSITQTYLPSSWHKYLLSIVSKFHINLRKFDKETNIKLEYINEIINDIEKLYILRNGKYYFL